MADLGGTVQDPSGAKYPETDAPPKDDDSPTAGTDRDFDEEQDADNQAHGHARDRQSDAGDAGHAEEKVTDADRSERDLGGPGG